MLDDVRKQIKQKKKDNRKAVNDLRDKLKKELEDFCAQETGHEFWDWQERRTVEMLFGYKVDKYRTCKNCGKTETVLIERVL